MLAFLGNGAPLSLRAAPSASLRSAWLSLFASLLFSALLLAAVPGCGSPQTGGGAAKPGGDATSKGTIGFSALTLKNPFFKIIADSLTEEAERDGYQVLVNDADRDVNTQSKHIDNYIAQGVTAIVINPADRVAIGPAIKKANEAGIPVFTCDLQCTAEDIEIAAHVGTDNLQGGRLAGEAMIEALGEAGGKVLVLHFKQANSCVLRVQGFTEVIDRHNQGRESGKVEIVAELDGGGLTDEGFSATADALQTHPDLAGIFAINDPSALGASRALKQAEKADQVKIVGFDGQQDGKQAIRDGEIYADPIQFPEQMGKQTMESIRKYVAGEAIQPVQLIPTQLYRQEDARNDPDLP